MNNCICIICQLSKSTLTFVFIPLCIDRQYHRIVCIVPKLSKYSIDSNIQIWLHGLPDYLPIFVNVSKNTGTLNIAVKTNSYSYGLPNLRCYVHFMFCNIYTLQKYTCYKIYYFCAIILISCEASMTAIFMWIAVALNLKKGLITCCRWLDG